MCHALQFVRIVRTTTLSMVACSAVLCFGMVAFVIDTVYGGAPNHRPLIQLWFKFVIHVVVEGTIGAALLYATVTGGFRMELVSALCCCCCVAANSQRMVSTPPSPPKKHALPTPCAKTPPARQLPSNELTLL